MLEDIYDNRHTSEIKKTINIYSGYNNETIDKIIVDYMNYSLNACSERVQKDDKSKFHNYIEIEVQAQIKHIKYTINLLQNALNVLDKRYITNIGARVQNHENSVYNEDTGEYDSKAEWTLIQVWRARCPPIDTPIETLESSSPSDIPNKQPAF